MSQDAFYTSAKIKRDEQKAQLLRVRVRGSFGNAQGVRQLTCESSLWKEDAASRNHINHMPSCHVTPPSLPNDLLQFLPSCIFRGLICSGELMLDMFILVWILVDTVRQ
jgi:hypothetical protein